MLGWKFVVLLLVAALTSCAPTTASLDASNAVMPASLQIPPTGYTLAWSDEFDRPGLPDASKWRYDTSRNREGWWNEEAQYYAAERIENSRVVDGKLVLEARKEDFAGSAPADHGRQKYSSARLITAGKAAWTYGMIDVRAKLPCGRGVWPAIWMLPDSPASQWPRDGEIDIMEHVGHDEGRVHATIHTGTYGHGGGNDRNASVLVTDLCRAFHNYQLLWTEEALTVAIDGKPFFHFPNDRRGNHATWPFDRPFHLLLNIAVGGAWGGQKGIDDAAFPVRMEVDYVRVYQQR